MTDTADPPTEARESAIVRDAQHDWVMQRARTMLTRGMSRTLIAVKLRLTDSQLRELNAWARKTTGRKR